MMSSQKKNPLPILFLQYVQAHPLQFKKAIECTALIKTCSLVLRMSSRKLDVLRQTLELEASLREQLQLERLLTNKNYQEERFDVHNAGMGRYHQKKSFLMLAIMTRIISTLLE